MVRATEEWIRKTDFRTLKSHQLRDLPGTAWLPLKKGGYTLVDSEDVYAHGNRKLTWLTGGGDRRNRKDAPYAAEGFKRLHRMIMDAPKGLQVDHINSNTLDNRRKNLRLANQSAQESNKDKRKGLTSKYKGVCKSKNGWVAAIYWAYGTYPTKKAALKVAESVEGAGVRTRNDLHKNRYQVFVVKRKTFPKAREAAVQRDIWAWQHWHSRKALNFPDLVG